MFRHCIKEKFNDEQTDQFWIVIQDMVAELQGKIKNTQWENLVPITKEFSIKEPEAYD